MDFAYNSRTRFETCRYCGQDLSNVSPAVHVISCTKTFDTPARQSSLTQQKGLQSSSSNSKFPEDPLSNKPVSQNSSKIAQNPGKIPQNPSNNFAVLKSNGKELPDQSSKPAFEDSKNPSKTASSKPPLVKPDSSAAKDNRIQCRKCKRMFNPDRIIKHQGVCLGPEAEKEEKPSVSGKQNLNMGFPKWKKQHMEFINNVRDAKNTDGGADDKLDIEEVHHIDPNEDYKKCQYCGKKFPVDALGKHSVACKPPAKAKTGAKPAMAILCGKCRSKVDPATKKCPICR